LVVQQSRQVLSRSFGTGPDGTALSQTITLNAATHTFTSADAYAHLTSATVAALLPGGDVLDTIAIGQSGALGLPIPSGAVSVTVQKENVSATGSTAGADETAGTVDATARTVIPSTSANGVKCFQFWFSYTQ
jgi:hypothetical protein